MDGKTTIQEGFPGVKTTKEPGDIAHEFDVQIIANAAFEFSFHRIGNAKVGKIIDVDADENRRFTVNNGTGKDAGFIWKEFHAGMIEGSSDIIKSVSWTSPKAVDSFL